MKKHSAGMWTLFEYRYRDADNFKAHGAVALEGCIDLSDWQHARKSFEDDLFIAEQLGIPPLYEQLYQWSNGPSVADHCWHEFVALTAVEETAVDRDTPRAGTAAAFVRRVAAVREWNGALSPHFAL